MLMTTVFSKSNKLSKAIPLDAKNDNTNMLSYRVMLFFYHKYLKFSQKLFYITDDKNLIREKQYYAMNQQALPCTKFFECYALDIGF